MKLINTQTGKILVEFDGKKACFHNKYLEQEMKSIGIPIPHGLRGSFKGQDQIFLEDELFQKAFKEIFYLTSIDHNLFKWDS